MPKFRRTLSPLSPRYCAPVIDLLEVWLPLLPEWIMLNILEQIVLPRLQNEVETWDPTTDTVPIHTWIHPWLPLMGGNLSPSVLLFTTPSLALPPYPSLPPPPLLSLSLYAFLFHP